MNILKLLLKFSCIAAAVMPAACNTFDESDPSSDYGYLQFKLFKAADAPESKATSGELEYLSDAYKLQVSLQREGYPSFDQTVLVNQVEGDNAEFGIRTEVLSLLPGKYNLTGYVVFDRTDKILYTGEPSSSSAVSVEPEKLSLCSVEVNVVERGKVAFSLVKDFVNSAEGTVMTKASGDVSYFSSIRKMNIELKEKTLYTPQSFSNVEGEYRLDHSEMMGGNASIVSDSLLSIPAGDWYVTRLEMMDDKGMALKTVSYDIPDAPLFTVKDNEITYFDIPVTIDTEAEYIKDYRALKVLWDALDGENWAWAPGTGTHQDNTNWNFDKDIDLWGDQPGVMLHPNGRVASLNIGSFNPSGDIPAEVFEQLTELTSLYIGSHNDVVQSGDLPEFRSMSFKSEKPVYNKDFNPWKYELEGSRAAFRMERNKAEMKALHRTSEKAVSKLIRFEQQRKGLAEEEPAPYAIVPYGYITNRVTSIPASIGNLKKLELLYIANTYISSIPEEIRNCQSLTDVEIYNCPRMDKFPVQLAELPNLTLLNVSQNYQWSHDELYNGLDEIFSKGIASKTMQILYCSYNNLTTIPQSISTAKLLGLLDFAKNELVTVPAFGHDFSPVQVMFEHNHITSLPDDLFNTDNLESMNVSDNDLTVFPNIFNAESEYEIGDVDLSFNKIESFPADFKGIRCVGELNLSGNRLTGGFPEAFINSGSYLVNINLAWNRLTEIGAKGLHAIDAKRHLKHLQAIDYEGNRISEMPGLDELEVGVDLPFLTGLSLSQNKFSTFPEMWFNGWGLNTLFFNHQIDDNGNKCFSKWPDGIEEKPALRVLQVAGNDIRTVRSFPIYLNYLDIMDNPNIVIEIPSDIRARIQNGSFKLVCDPDEQEGITGLE